MIAYSLERDRTKTHFEIEQNDSGVWHIVVTTESELKDLRYPSQIFHESSETDSFSLADGDDLFISDSFEPARRPKACLRQDQFTHERPAFGEASIRVSCVPAAFR